MQKPLIRQIPGSIVAILYVLFFNGTQALAVEKNPNILVVWSDDVGYWNVSAYNQGMMGYQTPNIDSIANDGVLFTDWYAQQSCTAMLSINLGE